MPARALTIGNFDGVHLGHRALLAQARTAVAARGGGDVVAVTFDPHPSEVVRPGRLVPRLGTIESRCARLREAGADEVAVLPATAELLGLAPEAFLEHVVETWGPDVIVEGRDFRFGRDRAGNLDALRTAAYRLGFAVEVVDPVEVALTNQQLTVASSTMVRWLVERGRMADVTRVLGRPYELQGPVVRGDQRGRTLGIPTANLDHGACLLPADGIYAGRATQPDGTVFAAAVSVGTKPTFGASPRVCEAHLLDWDGPLDGYGWTIRVTFDAWLRGQITYDGIEPLCAQLERDLAATRRRIAVPVSG